MVLGRNGKLRNDHRYVSAVAVLHGRTFEQDFVDAWWKDVPTEDARPDNVAEMLAASNAALRTAQVAGGGYTWVEVVETISAEAVPLPRSVFDGPRDRRFVPTADWTGLTEISGNQPPMCVVHRGRWLPA